MTSLHEPSGTRIWDRCQELARFSEETGALTRVFLSREQSAANELTRGWMRAAGMSAGLDAIGNVVGRYEASTPGAPLQGLRSSYFTNVSLKGRAHTEQTDATVDFNWGGGGPAVLAGRVDNFSIEWSFVSPPTM